MPQLGETVTGGTVTRWLKSVGDHVALDEPLLEVSTDKVDTEIPSAVAGVVVRLAVGEGETVPVGALLAVVGTEDAAPDRHDRDDSPDGAATRPDRSFRRSLEGGADLFAPVRVPRPTRPRTAAAAPPGAQDGGSTPGAAERARHPIDTRDVAERIPHSAIRRATATNLTDSVRTAAHTLVVAEVDYSRVDEARHAASERWRARHGFGLSYLPFVAVSVCHGLRAHPRLNASFDVDDLVVHAKLHLGIAVDLDFEGLVVPVVHDAGSLRLAAIAAAVHDLGRRARSRELTAGDVSGATFTLTNAGAHGTLVTAPIINPPQVAILSTDGVRARPVAVPDGHGGHGIAVHPIGNLALSFDHRAVDGAYASSFLDAVRRHLEGNDWTTELPGLVAAGTVEVRRA